jgi:hypothetical protein
LKHTPGNFGVAGHHGIVVLDDQSLVAYLQKASHDEERIVVALTQECLPKLRYRPLDVTEMDKADLPSGLNRSIISNTFSAPPGISDTDPRHKSTPQAGLLASSIARR